MRSTQKLKFKAQVSFVLDSIKALCTHSHVKRIHAHFLGRAYPTFAHKHVKTCKQASLCVRMCVYF